MNSIYNVPRMEEITFKFMLWINFLNKDYGCIVRETMHRDWIEQYEQMMFYQDTKGIEIAERLKYENMSTMFYKYRDDSENSIKAFKDDVLYFSAPSKFNDPYESANKELDYKVLVKKYLYDKYGIDFSGTGFDNLYDRNFDLIKRIALEGKEEPIFDLFSVSEEVYRSCCFSEIYGSILMWSHYSNMHQGFCLGYDFKSRPDNLLTQLLFPVIYDDTILDVMKPLMGNNIRGIALDALTRKASIWQYEKEWRCIKTASDSCKSEQVSMFMPSVIYLGSKIKDDVKERLINISKEKGIFVYQTYLSNKDFSIKANIVNY